MRKILTYIFIFLFIPMILVVFNHRQLSKDSNSLISNSIITNKIEDKKLWSSLNNEKFNQRLTKDKIINQEFKSEHNNLGTIAIQFTNFQRINDDYLSFKLTEKDTNQTIYENTYKTDQFNPDFPFTFGFPTINNSKNKTYIFELKSTSGTTKNSVALANVKYFIIKYDFSLSTVKNKPINLMELFLINLSNLKKININQFNYLLFIYISFVFLFIFRKKVVFLFKKFFFTSKKIILKIYSKLPLKLINSFLEKIAPFSIFIITFLVAGYFSSIGTDPHHDGIMFKPALDVSQGSILFKDTFTQYGALSTWIQSLAIKLFGEYLLITKLVTAFFYGLIATATYFITCRFLSKKNAFLSFAIWLLLAPYYVLTFLPWSSVYTLFFQSLALFCFIKFFETNNKTFILLAGINSALTFWCKQNVGGYVIFASFLTLLLIPLITRKKIITILPLIYRYIFGGIIVSLPIFIYLFASGALIDWWKQSILYLFVFIGSRSNISFINSMLPASSGVISIWTIMPIASLIIFLKSIFQKKPNTIITAISLFGLFSWLQYYPVACLRHLYWAATPMIGLTFYLLFSLSEYPFQKKSGLKYLLYIFLIVILFHADITYRIKEGYKKINQDYFYLEEPKILKGTKLTKQEYNFYQKSYQEIQDYKKKFNNTNLITVGPNALYLTFSDSKNFHPMYVNWGTNVYTNYSQIKDAYIKSNQPLIYSIWNYLPPGYCKISDLINESDTSFLTAPCENLIPSK